MDQWLIAAIALVVIMAFVVVYEIIRAERQSRKATAEVHSGPDDVEKRARRAF